MAGPPRSGQIMHPIAAAAGAATFFGSQSQHRLEAALWQWFVVVDNGEYLMMVNDGCHLFIKTPVSNCRTLNKSIMQGVLVDVQRFHPGGSSCPPLVRLRPELIQLRLTTMGVAIHHRDF